MIIKNPMYVKMGTDVSDTTATAADVLSGKEFYLANGTKATGQIVTYTGTRNVTPIEQAQTLPTQGKYVDGDITVDAIPSRYKDTTGTDALAGDILAGKKAVTGAGLVTGSVQTYAGTTTVTQNGILPTAGKYVASDIEVQVPQPSPVLITKNITENGTYSAASDNADGYSSVTVNVGSAIVEEKDVNFYDYDGTLVASYTAADFANLSAMPSNPSHTGLTAQGWNWTLADAKTCVASYGKLNIGQMYATTSGKTEYDVEINEASGMTATLTGTSGTDKDWGDGTTDTLETHTYASAGNYTIKLSGTTLPIVSNSKKLLAVRIANGVTSIGSSAFGSCYLLQYITIPSSVTSIESSAFQNCSWFTSVTIPSSVTSIGSSAFNSCYSLQYIMIPSSVTSIGSSAFASCYSLQSVTIPSSVTSIDVFVFRYCYLLQYITIQSGVTLISVQSFRACRSLLSVTIPSSVTSIGSSVFEGCSWLTIMTVLATTPPELATTGAIPANVTKIYIPNGTLTDYQTASNWSNFSAKFVELPA